MGIFDAIGGRPEGAPERAFDVGEKLGAYRQMNSASAKLQSIMDARQKGITDRQTNAVNEHKARSAKILGVLQDGITQPEGHPKRVIAEQLAQTIQSNPAFMGSLGFKTGSSTSTAVGDSFLQQVLGGGGQQGGGITPGTTIGVKTSAGTVNVPLNPKLNNDEASSVAGAEKFEGIVRDITKLIDSGILNKKDGKSSTYKQWLAEGGGNAIERLLTKDGTPLESLASLQSELKKFAFAEGGKQLTPSEQKVVNAGLSFVGKSNQQIKKDIVSAIEIIRNKKVLALGGANASGNLQSNKQQMAPAKTGGVIKVDANGNKAIVYPDGSYEEVE